MFLTESGWASLSTRSSTFSFQVDSRFESNESKLPPDTFASSFNKWLLGESPTLHENTRFDELFESSRNNALTSSGLLMWPSEMRTKLFISPGTASSLKGLNTGRRSVLPRHGFDLAMNCRALALLGRLLFKANGNNSTESVPNRITLKLKCSGKCVIMRASRR